MFEQAMKFLDEMKKAGLTDHPAYDWVLALADDLAGDGGDQDERLHHYLGLPGPYVDMTKAEVLYRQWCQTKGIRQASMSRGNGPDKKDAPCLVYVAGASGCRPTSWIWRVD